MRIKRKAVILLAAALILAVPIQSAAEVTYYNYGEDEEDEESDDRDRFAGGDEDAENGPGVVNQVTEDQNPGDSGPVVEDVTLSEQYHEEYGTYEESMAGKFFIYSNVGNGGFSDVPVYVDIPANLTWTMEKDGVPVEYASGQMVGEKGTYVLKLSGVENPEMPLSRQTEYKAVFRFRIQDKLPEAETEPAEEAAAVREEEVRSFYEGTGAAGEEESSAAGESLSETVPEDETASDETAEGSIEEQPLEEVSTGAMVQSYNSATGRYDFTASDGSLFSATVPEGMKGCEGVSLYLEEGQEFALYKDGEALEYVSGTGLEEPGAYRLEIGGSFFHFTVGSFLNQDKLYTAPLGMIITQISLNGETSPLEYDRYAWLLEDGVYEIWLSGEEGESRQVMITKDSAAPKAEISLTKSRASIAYLSEDIESVSLVKDGGEPQRFRGTEINSPGNYRLILTDQAGNETSYDFSLSFQLNFYAIFAVVLCILLIVGGIFFVRYTKKNMKVR